MKYNYPQLIRKMCKMSVGCMRLENPNFISDKNCKYAEKENWKQEEIWKKEK